MLDGMDGGAVGSAMVEPPSAPWERLAVAPARGLEAERGALEDEEERGIGMRGAGK
jgi:hypothetical protein